MTLRLRIALRDWDYMTPLVLGDVRSPRLDIKIDRVGTLVSNVALDPSYDAAEMSFSRYAQQRHDGDDSVVGMPNFIMRGFRHRCIITTKKSSIRKLSDLGGKSDAESRFWTVTAVVALVLGAGCAIGAIATGTFALVRERDRALAVSGLALGLLPVLGTVAVAFFSLG